MESSRGLIPEIFGVQQQLINSRYSSVAGCSNPSSTASCAATARGASYGTSTGEIHPVFGKTTHGNTSRNTKTLQTLFFQVIFYGLYRGEPPLNHHWGAYFWNVFQASFADPKKMRVWKSNFLCKLIGSFGVHVVWFWCRVLYSLYSLSSPQSSPDWYQHCVGILVIHGSPIKQRCSFLFRGRDPDRFWF